MAVPLGIAAVLGSIGLVGLLVCFDAGIRKTPSPVHLLCMIIIALFFMVCAVSFVRVAFNGFIKEVQVTDKGLTVVKMRSAEEYEWTELNRIAATDTALNLRMMSGAELDFGPSLEGFPELVQLVKERYRILKGIKGPPPGV